MTRTLKQAERRVVRAAMRWYYALEALEKGEVDERGGSPMENLDEAACEAESFLDRACAALSKQRKPNRRRSP